MPAKAIIVEYERADGTTDTVTLNAERTERDRDGTLRAYVDGTEIAEVPNATYAVAEEHISS